MVSGGLIWVMVKTIFTCAYIGKKSSPKLAGQYQSNLVQYTFGWKELQIVQIRDQILFKGEIITKIWLVYLMIFSLRTTGLEKHRFT
jgi:hypothetical protein